METLTRSIGPSEVRVYCFKHDAKTVQAFADKELTALGYRTSRIKKSQAWSLPLRPSVWIQPGRVLANKPYETVVGSEDWVTVYVDEEVDENLLNQIRAQFAPDW